MTTTARNFLLISSLILAYSCLTACDRPLPVAEFKKSHEHDEYSQAVSVRLSVRAGQIPEGTVPDVRLFEKYNPTRSYPVNIEVDKKISDTFIIGAVNLPAGNYRMIAEIPYRSSFLGISTGKRSKTIIHDIVVHATLAGSCFNFNEKKDDVMGWSSSHVFAVGQEQPVSADTCPGLFFVNTSWPTKLNQKTEGGSLFVPISAECFPKTSNQMSEDPHWTFSIRSPNLTALKSWQKISSINLRVASGTIPVKVVPEVHYLFGDKKLGTRSIGETKKIFELSGDGWNLIEYPFELPESAIITGVELHFFGVPEQTVGDQVNSIFIDGICPKK